MVAGGREYNIWAGEEDVADLRRRGWMSVCSGHCAFQRSRQRVLTSASWPGSWAESLNSMVRVVCASTRAPKGRLEWMAKGQRQRRQRDLRWQTRCHKAEAGGKGIRSAGAEPEVVSVLWPNTQPTVLMPEVVVMTSTNSQVPGPGRAYSLSCWRKQLERSYFVQGVSSGTAVRTDSLLRSSRGSKLRRQAPHIGT